MCGITGFLDFTHNSNLSTLKRMTDSLVHRGPDDSGYELIRTNQAMIGLGHRRLAILDLSAEGKQPMTSATGRYMICFNGEIYNFLEIQSELESCGVAPRWRGHSDTEVLLAAIEHWGLQQALQRSIGMFALALWDKKERALLLARDRMGEKPLYYGWQGKTFLFGSELKALRKHPAWERSVDHAALSLYIRYGYIPAPYSIYQGISKLTQGTTLRLDIHDLFDQHPIPEPYWSLFDVVCSGMKNPFKGDEQEAVDELECLLLNAVGRQMISDVPLGAFLSGGYDSSLITALMQAQSAKPVKTFSIGFYEQRYNEAQHAKSVAEYLGTEHTELYITPEQVIEVVPKLFQLYDEPFADSSQIPTYLLSSVARKHVSVALSGDGGDELMRGYFRYNQARSIWDKIGTCPSSFRGVIGRTLMGVPSLFWDTVFFWMENLLQPYVASGPVSDKIYKIAEVFLQPDFYCFYNHLVSVWKHPEKVMFSIQDTQTLFDTIGSLPIFKDTNRGMLYIDTMAYLPDDLLVKLDRAAMGVSLETRIPLLDHNVVEFIWSLPNRFRWRNGVSKWALRQVLYKYIPQAMIDRPKKGFSVPIDDWIRYSLKEWVSEMLLSEEFERQKIFRPDIVKQIWQEHMSMKYQRGKQLWVVLMASFFWAAIQEL